MKSVDELAEEMFLHSCANRFDNLTKDGQPKDPYNVTTGWKDIHECAQYHYKVLAQWHLNEVAKLNHNK